MLNLQLIEFGMSSLGAVTDCLGSVEDNYPNNRFNDAKCDSSGRLWAGTLSMAHPSVTDRGCGLYSFYNGKLMYW